MAGHAGPKVKAALSRAHSKKLAEKLSLKEIQFH
jgi:hypothetical protein